MVMAMPKPMAEAIGWPRTDVGWRDLIGLVAEQKGWKALNQPQWGPSSSARPTPTCPRPGWRR